MKVSRFVGVMSVVTLLIGPVLLTAQSGGQPPPMPKPGPEHELFKMDVGTWDATIENSMPGAPPSTTKGTEVNTIGCGGLCLISDFKGEAMPGMSFEGHGIGTWDVAKKKYVGSWTDSMSGGLATAESTWDPATKKFTGWMEGPDMTGKVMKTRSVVEYRSDGTRVFTMFAPGPDGKEMQMMRITYRRRT
jgi:hypothetical protein